MNFGFRAKRKHLSWLAAILAIVGLVICVLYPKDDTLRVPLGVEQAAIVTSSGPRLAVAPYKWGVAVNVRIAGVTERPDRRIYDLRYIVNRVGTYDLKDYLIADDGSALTGLPTFRFAGDPRLSKDLDQRIRETEEIRVEVGGRYFETMTVLTLLWVGWLFLLIFWKRPKLSAGLDAGPPPPTLAELMKDFLAQLEAGTLDVDAKARLEMVMLHCWRNDLSLGNEPMDRALAQIASHDKTSEALKKLQHWLHHPRSKVSSGDIAAVIKPYTGTVETTP